MDPLMATILPFAATFAPVGWLDCIGQEVGIQQNAALFSLLGTTYGGNGQTTFGIPDLRGRVIVGQGAGPGLASYSMGQKAGVENVTLTVAQIPAHSHGAVQANSTVSGGSVTGLTATLAASQAITGHSSPLQGEYLAAMFEGVGGASVSAYVSAASAGATVNLGGLTVSGGSISGATVANGAITITQTGGNQAHSNMQPYLVLRYIICSQGIYPSRS